MWTTEMPVLPGYYWWRARAGMDAVLVEVHGRLPGCEPTTTWPGQRIGHYPVSEIAGQWFGPLTPPA